jgi:glycosyltransferase involved in cell wall biosynthesis
MGNILIISIMRADRTIGGFAFRFVSLYEHLRASGHANVFLLTNKSMLDSFEQRQKRPLEKNGSLFVFNDLLPLYKVRRILLAFPIVWIILRYRIRTVHLAAGGIQYLPFFTLLSKLLPVRIAITFPSNSLDMASYGGQKKQWIAWLSAATNVDLLNPNYSLPEYKFKKFVSPCSFPLNYQAIHDLAVKDAARKNQVVFAASMAVTKNPLLAVEGMLHFCAARGTAFPDAQMIVFGRGVLFDKVREKADQCNAMAGREAVRFGQESMLFEALAESKVFLSLQDYDNYPSQSLMEAMLFSNTIIATNVGYTSKIVLPEYGNILLASKSPEELGNAIFKALTGFAVNRENRRFIETNHTVERFAKYFLAMHESLQ